MEEGQKIDISLESLLDTKSSDMLVSINDIKFAHNRQKYQGHVLPTSLRYESDGWAAGWYVYKFDFDGGDLILNNESMTYAHSMALSRLKLNNTPSYILSFKYIENDKPRAEVAKLWYNDKSYINAEEFDLAEITVNPDIDIRLKYTIDGNIYDQEFVFNNDLLGLNEEPSFSTEGEALELSYLNMEADGTVHALCTNNKVTWEDTYTIHVPQDLVQDNIKWAEFKDVTNGTISWKLIGLNKILSYSAGVFSHDTTGSITNGVFNVDFPYNVVFNVPLQKYYASMQNVAYTMQGSNTLFNNEDRDDPANSYDLSIEHIQSNNYTIYDKQGSFVVGLPDIDLKAVLQIPCNELDKATDRDDIVTNYGTYHPDTIPITQSPVVSSQKDIPIGSVKVSDFKLKDTDSGCNAIVQIYYRQSDNTPAVFKIPSSYVRVYVEWFQVKQSETKETENIYGYFATYEHGNMSNIEEDLQIRGVSSSNTGSFKLNNSPKPNNNPVNITTANIEDAAGKLYIGSRDIVGRKFKLTVKLNGVASSNISGYGINTNLNFSKSTKSYNTPVSVDSVDYSDGTDRLNSLNSDLNIMHDHAGSESDYTVNIAYDTGTSHIIASSSTTFTFVLNDASLFGSTLANQLSSLTCLPVAKLVSPDGTNYLLLATVPLSGYSGSVDLSDYTNSNLRYIIIKENSDNFEWIDTSTCHVHLNNSSVIDDSGNTNVVEDNYYLLDVKVNIASVLQELKQDSNKSIYSESNNIVIDVVSIDNNILVHSPVELEQNEQSNLYISGILPVTVTGNIVAPVQYDNSIYYVYTDTGLITISVAGTSGFIGFLSGSALSSRPATNSYVIFEGYYRRFYDYIYFDDPSKLFIDIINADTGEVLVDHLTDSNTIASIRMDVYTGKNNTFKGKLFYYNPVTAHLPAYASDIHKVNSLTGAFFPLHKPVVSTSIYSVPVAEQYSTCQGIALFNTAGVSGYGNTTMTLLSSVTAYTAPPVLSGNDLTLFAKRSFTNKLIIKTESFGGNLDKYYINDNTDISKMSVEPRDVFNSTSEGSDIEVANKYYETTNILQASSAIYQNNTLEVTFNFKPASGTIRIGNQIYDFGNAETAVKMSARLLAYYLPEYPVDYKYILTLKDNITVTHTKVNDLRNNISDTDKYYAEFSYDWEAIQLNVDSAVVPVTVKMHDALNNTVLFDSTLNAAEEKYTSSVYNNNLAFVDTNGIFDAASNSQQLIVNLDTSIALDYVLPDIDSNKVSSFDIDGNVIHIEDDSNSVDYDCFANSMSDMKISGLPVSKYDFTLSSVDNTDPLFIGYTVDIKQKLNTEITFKYKGVYKVTNNVDALVYSNGAYTVSFSYNVGNTIYNGAYTFDFSDFEDSSKCTQKTMTYSATDVRTGNTKQFAKVICEDELQLVKQQFNTTVEVENFWWLDADHILQLTKDRFVVLEKYSVNSADTGEEILDDWNGDNWKVLVEYDRKDYITSEADRFIVTSVSGTGTAFLIILMPVDYDTFMIKTYDVLNDMSEVDYTYNIKHIKLGNELNGNIQNVIYTYASILSTSLLTDSKLSAVTIDSNIWLGIQYDNNFNQWSICVNTGDIIQGYGCVGINGYATGGNIPSKYFSKVNHIRGFNSVVQDIGVLDAEDVNIDNVAKLNVFNERVVGDDSQQWYISEKLSGIVLAVNLNEETTVEAPITNNYSQIYSSPSYARYTAHALSLNIKAMYEMFGGANKNPVWATIMTAAVYPFLYYLSPYTNVINYLQQTLGQYAYVHYNTTSTSKTAEKKSQELFNGGLSGDDSSSHIDALLTDDLSFDVQHIPQEQSFGNNAWNSILGIFASMVVSATDYAIRDNISVNTAQNQSAVSDIGRKFNQAFMQNIGSMSVTGFTMHSTKPMLKSEVTAVKTLDMFYSTSAEQKCFAGPGFVNSAFVAQCTAQSVTSVQLEAQQTQIFLLLKDLTLWYTKLINKQLDQLADVYFKQAEVQSSGPSAGTAIIEFGWIISLVLTALGYAVKAAKIASELAIEVVESIISTLFPSGMKVTVTAQLSRHNYDVEGKHAYGNKSEQFFWPCADCNSKLYTDETVKAILQKKPWPLEMPTVTIGNNTKEEVHSSSPKNVTIRSKRRDEEFNGEVEYNIASCKGEQRDVALPKDMAYIVGTNSFLPSTAFRNDNIGEGEPVFTPPAIQDYVLDKNWNIFVTAMAGDALWVSCKDTKLFDGNYSNIIVSDNFCGIACSHTAIEIKHGISKEYLRPWAVTPDAIALNITGLNCAYDEVAYHAFDGYGYRITDWVGSAGMNKEHYTLQYCFQVNDRFKRSNKLPPNQFMGNFQTLPNMSLDVKDDVFNQIQITAEEKGMESGVTGENKDQFRYALPIFTEHVCTLPAIVKAHSSYKLAVIEGITSLTTDTRTSQTAYKLPVSIDFNINDQLFRMTNEYICSVKHEDGLEIVQYLVPALGLTYLGSTPFMAYFYNQATRQYYIYQGGNTLQVIDMLERFRDIKGGYYDFINQEVVMPCFATMSRLDKNVKDDADETDNIVIPVFRRNNVGGELTPPITTIFNTRSMYRTVSTPAGMVFQGPNRCIINRFVWSDYMLEDIKRNKGKWEKVPREDYHPFRKYKDSYKYIAVDVDSGVQGWTHNPFLLVTSPIGVNEQTDCKFEWEITFAWTVEMEKIFDTNEYVTVNIMAETMCPGGKVFSRPTHIFLHKELFTRSDNYGYYSFRYQSNNGAGNRERLHVWSDGYIAVSSLQLEYKVISDKRNEILVTQEDIKGLKEM